MSPSLFSPMRADFRHSQLSQTALRSSSATTINDYAVKNEGNTAHSPPNNASKTENPSILIRGLPMIATEDTLKMMLIWSKDLIAIEFLSDQNKYPGFRSAVLRFKTHDGAMEAKKVLDGNFSVTNDGQSPVEILVTGPEFQSQRHGADSSLESVPSNTSLSAAPSAFQPFRQTSRVNVSFQPTQRMSAMNIACTRNELPIPGDSVLYQSLFSPHSPIGNHLNERIRVTGKSLIKNDTMDDDETGELLKDPLAYAENGLSVEERRQRRRRPTSPKTPLSQMSGLTLNATNIAIPALMPNYSSPKIASSRFPTNPISPMTMVNDRPPMNCQLGYQLFPRLSFPPINPADHNPPCNTLYVGNLPMNTSEDELKAMFSKQRGYKRLCFRTKQSGPMCFVEFEDTSFATKALHELYGYPLRNSIKGGIRLSFSKNPLGVRSGQSGASPGPRNFPGPMRCMNGPMINNHSSSFGIVAGPLPGLAAPPGFGPNHSGYTFAIPPMAPALRHYGVPLYARHDHRDSWTRPAFHHALAAGGTPGMTPHEFPAYMMGR